MHSIAHKRPRACLHVCLHVCTRGRLHVCRSVNNRPGPMLAAVSRPLLAAVSRPSARTRGRQYLHPGIVYILHTAYTAVYTRVHTYARLCTRAAVNTLTRGRAYLARFMRQSRYSRPGRPHTLPHKVCQPVWHAFCRKALCFAKWPAWHAFCRKALCRAKHFVAHTLQGKVLCGAKRPAEQSRNPTGRPTDREQIRERTRWCSARDASSSASTTTSLLREEDEEDERSEERPSTAAGLRIRD